MKVHHVCIETSTYNESIFFYTKILNFSLKKETSNFHGRDYNSWLELNGFYIELQTPKNTDEKESSQNITGLVHICFFVDNIVQELERIKSDYNKFKLKNNEILYNVEGGLLFKLIAPEGTIIEIRDNPLF
ncbi:MAG: VOC family protein [Cetobacterium sp.]